MKNYHTFDCSFIALEKIFYKEGNLSVVENNSNFPFKVKRIFYLYDIPGGADRGAHAHYDCHQFIVAASGSFEINMYDGKFSRQVQLNRPYIGLYVPPGIWTSVTNFSSGSIALVLASHCYDESDYIRNKYLFESFKSNHLK